MRATLKARLNIEVGENIPTKTQEQFKKHAI